METLFGFVPLAAEFHDSERITSLTQEFSEILEQIGGQLCAPEMICEFPLLVVCVLTGGTERRIIELWRDQRSACAENPVFLLAHPGLNSLPAAMEALAFLRGEGVPGRVFYLEGPHDSEGIQQITETLFHYRVREELRGARIGLIGQPSEWLVASSPPPDVIETAWGVEVVEIPLERLYTELESADSQAIQTLAEEFTAGAERIVEPREGEIADAVRVYLALRAVVEKHGLDALSLPCSEMIASRRLTGCYGVARLNDEGIIAGCEGDLVSVLTMLWALRLTEQLPWMANAARVDPKLNSIWLAHCTVPLSLTRTYTLRSHFESGMGVAIAGELPATPVTLARIGGPRLDRLWTAEGQIVGTADAEDLCRTQMVIILTHGEVADLMAEPLGSHLVAIPGSWAKLLREWWREMFPGS